MLSKNNLREIVHLQRKWIEDIDTGIPRTGLEDIKISSNFALIITGIRRSGKSTLLSQVLEKQRNFYFLNLEDPRLEGFELSDFTKIDTIFKEEYGQKGVYFFDEIQNIPKWENFIRFLIDRGEKVVLTGSNASLLSRELGTKLTGRHIDLSLLPFSYQEFLKLKKRKASLNSFDEYFQKGGFPGFLKSGNSETLNILLNDVLMRDIVIRFGIRNSQILRRLAAFMISNVGKKFSFNSIKTNFQIKSVQTVIDYISYFEDSYLIFSVPKFSYSYKKQLVAQKKFYSIDNGLSNINSISFSKDKGRMLENLVFLHLKRRFKEILYYSENYECDFIIKEREKVSSVFQVCYDLNEENKQREINGLLEAMEEFDLDEGMIISFDQEDSYEIKGKKIKVIPAWKWMSE